MGLSDINLGHYSELNSSVFGTVSIRLTMIVRADNDGLGNPLWERSARPLGGPIHAIVDSARGECRSYLDLNRINPDL